MVLPENIKRDKETVIHILRTKRKIKNPENVKAIDPEDRIFSHTNSRGKIYYFKVMERRNYHNSAFYRAGITHYNNGFYAVIMAENLCQIYNLIHKSEVIT